jgi:hypothetical protein
MHIILALVGILGGIAFWWWRFKMGHEAASEMHDVAGRAWGKYKRYKFRKKVESSPVEAVDDPVAAAVVMMLAVAQEEGPLKPETEAAIRRETVETMGVNDATELMVFGKWVASHVEDANNVSLRYAKLWMNALDSDERRDLVTMVDRAVGAAGALSPRQLGKIARLRERLSLTD